MINSYLYIYIILIIIVLYYHMHISHVYVQDATCSSSCEVKEMALSSISEGQRTL